MKKTHVLIGLIGALLLGWSGAAAVGMDKARAATTGEAPELGRPGPYKIGTAVRAYTLVDRSTITGLGAATGHTRPIERIVSVRFWYPADPAAAGRRQAYDHVLGPAKGKTLKVSSQGFTYAEAAPLSGQKLPLVLMSHGYGGWNTQFSKLAEHIASHGYVVASIEHADMPADSVAAFALSFSNVLAERMLDQRQVLNRILAERSTGSGPAYLAMIDQRKIGLIGYSMGGYGALATVGANYSFAHPPLSNLPQASQTALEKAAEPAAPISAVVLFAPWGGQPESRAWTSVGLANIRIPALVVVGNQDDVTDFKNGVSWIFDNMIHSDRYMLVYREARHNIVGDALDIGDGADFAAYESLREPVWRSDRLNMINQHFVTAFLDLNLKGDDSKRAYLDVPTPDSDAAQWPLPFGAQLDGKFADEKQPQYWRGFQRRWATGIELHHKAPDAVR